MMGHKNGRRGSTTEQARLGYRDNEITQREIGKRREHSRLRAWRRNHFAYAHPPDIMGHAVPSPQSFFLFLFSALPRTDPASVLFACRFTRRPYRRVSRRIRPGCRRPARPTLRERHLGIWSRRLPPRMHTGSVLATFGCSFVPESLRLFFFRCKVVALVLSACSQPLFSLSLCRRLPPSCTQSPPNFESLMTATVPAAKKIQVVGTRAPFLCLARRVIGNSNFFLHDPFFVFFLPQGHYKKGSRFVMALCHLVCLFVLSLSY